MNVRDLLHLEGCLICSPKNQGASAKRFRDYSLTKHFYTAAAMQKRVIAMQAIVLAAGEGSRMRPLTSNRPKVMLPVAGRPLLEHIIIRAREAGVDRFVLVVGYGADIGEKALRRRP